MHDLWRTSFPTWEFVLRGAIVYIFVLFLLRLGGKREIGQMGPGEFVAILLVSNAVQNAMNGGDNSISGGLLLSTVIVLLSVFVAYITYRSKRMEALIQGEPRVLVLNGRIVARNLHKELISVHELKAILRRQGIHDFSDIAMATLESDGFISVTKKSELESHEENIPLDTESE